MDTNASTATMLAYHQRCFAHCADLALRFMQSAEKLHSVPDLVLRLDPSANSVGGLQTEAFCAGCKNECKSRESCTWCQIGYFQSLDPLKELEAELCLQNDVA